MATNYYTVKVKEIHYQDYRVAADSPEDAIDSIMEGEGELIEGALEYSHTGDADDWRVEGPIAEF